MKFFKKELNGFNEIKAEKLLGKEVCDSFWKQLLNSKIDLNKISGNIAKIGEELYNLNTEELDNRKNIWMIMEICIELRIH